ncbi:MAG: hypothetical protein IJ815_04805 [Lachnospiraceae bacterium]|nr:hypothetical protein [Lachnospiraceae bacterium]
MNEKKKEALNEIWENLTDEQKEKWKACKSEEEFMAFISKEGIKLPDNIEGEVSDDEAEAAAGGRSYYVTPSGQIWYPDEHGYDDKGPIYI